MFSIISPCSYRIETTQWICNSNQLTGFCVVQFLLKVISEQTLTFILLHRYTISIKALLKIDSENPQANNTSNDA